MAKRTQEQAQLIVDEVVGLLSNANDFVSIQKHISKKYSISIRHTTTYIQKAREFVQEHFAPDVDKVRYMSNMRYELLFKKSWTKEDYRECRKVVDSQCRLVGANAPEDLNVNTGVDLSKYSEEEKALMVKMNRKRG